MKRDAPGKESPHMATFYVLPPRPFLGRCYATYLQTLFPGLAWDDDACSDLADRLSAVAAGRQDVYLVYREELPEDDDLARGLADAFGAEPGDEVIEVCPGRDANRWRLGRAA
jgi:hypothetical protein